MSQKYIGGSMGKGGNAGPTEVSDSFRSVQLVSAIDLLSEGEIEGLMKPLGGGEYELITDPAEYGKGVYIDRVPVLAINGEANLPLTSSFFTVGTVNQGPFPGFDTVQTPTIVNRVVTYIQPVEVSFGSGAQELRILLRIGPFFEIDASTGEVNGTDVTYRFSLAYNDQPEPVHFLEVGLAGKTRGYYEKTHTIRLDHGHSGGQVIITRTKVDSTSIHLEDKIQVAAVTQVTYAKLRYPHSALFGFTLNSDTVQSISERLYHVRGVKVRVPVNYFPIGTVRDDGSIRDHGEYTRNPDGTQNANPVVWDGTFYSAWTNNPAWIFYDLLTNSRYGLGNTLGDTVYPYSATRTFALGEFCRIEETGAIYRSLQSGNLNHAVSNTSWWELDDNIAGGIPDKWGLYSIGQYCDELVESGEGGTEPRFTCNCYLRDRRAAYDVLKDLASVFRGMVYWSTGQVVAVQDRDSTKYPKWRSTTSYSLGAFVSRNMRTYVSIQAPNINNDPEFEPSYWSQDLNPADSVKTFGPANVENGVFTYSSSSKRARHTTALVQYYDPSDFFQSKMHYCEDADGIAELGVNPLRLAAFACTSRGQAYRAGRWALLTELYETETVRFTTGFEGLLLRPGHIISIADPIKTSNVKRMSGRLLNATISQLTLDAPVQLTAGQTTYFYVINPESDLQAGATDAQITSLDNLLMVGSITAAQTEETSVINLAANLSHIPQIGSMWLAASVNYPPKQYKVLGMSETKPGTVEILALAYLPGKYAAVEQDVDLGSLPTESIPNPFEVQPPTAVTVSSEFSVLPEAVQRKLRVVWVQSTSPFIQHYVVEYRYKNSNWLPAATSPFNDVTFNVNVAGEYLVRVKAVTTVGASSAYAYSDPFSMDEQLLENASITGLEIEGQGNDTYFYGPNPKFVWRLNSPSTLTEISDSAAGLEHPLLRGYIVQILHPVTSTVIRETLVTQPEFIYRLEDNEADGNGNPLRSFIIRVSALDKAGYISVASELAVENPPPYLGPLPPAFGDSIRLETTNGNLVLNFDAPTDSDFKGVLVFISPVGGASERFVTIADLLEDDGETLKASSLLPYDQGGALVYRGNATRIALPFAYATYRLVVAPYDSFGLDSLNYYGPEETTLTLTTDGVPPQVPVILGVYSSALKQADGTELVQLSVLFHPYLPAGSSPVTILPYNGATTYSTGDYVGYQGRVYRSLTNSNLANTPPTSPLVWEESTTYGRWTPDDSDLSMYAWSLREIGPAGSADTALYTPITGVFPAKANTDSGSGTSDWLSSLIASEPDTPTNATINQFVVRQVWTVKANTAYEVTVASIDFSGNASNWATPVQKTSSVDSLAPAAPGEWSATTTYALNVYTFGSNGSLYKSLQAANLNHDPISSPTYWQLTALAPSPFIRGSMEMLFVEFPSAVANTNGTVVTDLAYYQIYVKATTADLATAVLLGNFNATVLSFNQLSNAALTVGLDYHVWVKAVDTSGNVSAARYLGYAQPGTLNPNYVSASLLTKFLGGALILDNLTSLTVGASSGLMSWSAFTIHYNGSSYSISAGATTDSAHAYVVWNKGGTTLSYYSDEASFKDQATKVLLWRRTGTVGSYSVEKVWFYAANAVFGSVWIADALIQSAMIGSMTATKISAGNLTAAMLVTTGSISGGSASWSGSNPTGTGFYLSASSSVPKFFIGNSSGARIVWNGTTLSLVGDIILTSLTTFTYDNLSGNVPINASTRKLQNTASESSNPAASGLYLRANRIGFFDLASLTWPVQINNDGTFVFKGGTGVNKLEWNGATFTVRGTIEADGGRIANFTIDTDKLTLADGTPLFATASTYFFLKGAPAVGLDDATLQFSLGSKFLYEHKADGTDWARIGPVFLTRDGNREVMYMGGGVHNDPSTPFYIGYNTNNLRTFFSLGNRFVFNYDPDNSANNLFTISTEQLFIDISSDPSKRFGVNSTGMWMGASTFALAQAGNKFHVTWNGDLGARTVQALNLVNNSVSSLVAATTSSSFVAITQAGLFQNTFSNGVHLLSQSFVVPADFGGLYMVIAEVTFQYTDINRARTNLRSYITVTGQTTRYKYTAPGLYAGSSSADTASDSHLLFIAFTPSPGATIGVNLYGSYLYEFTPPNVSVTYSSIYVLRFQR